MKQVAARKVARLRLFGGDMKDTLYLSDLDGTLLRSDQTLSGYTCDVINRLVAAGEHFSYATARGPETARKVTQGMSVRLPVIVHNGAFIVDSLTGQPLWSATFTSEEEKVIYDAFLSHGLFPLTYAVIDGKNRYSYLKDRCSEAQWNFILTRQDSRTREIVSEAQALDGDVYYFACIADEEEALVPVLHTLEKRFRCIFSRDIYTDAPWLEVLPHNASKASAARILQQKLGCKRLVCFGDAVNDLPMFEIADERYAVAGAAQVLKDMACVIGDNDDDAVARWLESHLL